MNDLPPGLIQRHRQWQADTIFQMKRHKRTPKRELRLLRSQITERQKELARSVELGSDALSAYMRSKLDIGDDLPVSVPSLSRIMTLDEFRTPTFPIELALAESLVGKVSRSQARHPVFWCICMLEWSKAGVLPVDLRAALLVGQSRKTQEALLEHQTRNFIRRTGGIDVERSKISVLSDCPISRAWWRRTIAIEAANASNGEIDVDTAHRILHASDKMWEEFALDALRRLTSTSHPRLRAAVICAFPAAQRGNKTTGEPKLRAVARELGRLGTSTSLQHIPWSEMRDLAASVAATVGP